MKNSINTNSKTSKTKTSPSKATKTTKRATKMPSKNTKLTTKSKLYKNLDGVIGTWNVRVASSSRVGVKVSSLGTKKGSVVEMILPSTTPEGVPCTVRVCLTGRQARAVYETLARHQNKA